jgi:SAM-dependent methyltransferase
MPDWTNVAAWYNAMNPWGPGDDFYLDLMSSAARVLDVGCGTGTLLRRARDTGHTGRLCGLDPDPDMLDQARTRTDIEWVPARAAAATWDREFDLAVMTGHAFQELVEDDELRASLRAIRSALVEGGRFAFETRHPRARAWEGWHHSSFEARNPDGDPVQVSYEVLDVTGDVGGTTVRLTETLAGPWWDTPQVGHGRLRFVDPDALDAFLAEAGFTVEERYGDWDRAPFTDTSEEIITIARRTAD